MRAGTTEKPLVMSYAERIRLANFIAVRLVGGLPPRKTRAREILFLIEYWLKHEEDLR